MDDLQLRHLAIVLSNLTDASVDWAEVVKARGTTRKDNAARDFKVMMKKFGIEYHENKFSIIGESVIADPNLTSAKKPKATTPRKRKPKATEGDTDGGNDESASPKKKQKGKKAVEAEVEEEAAGDDEV